jgi:pimeloyl-ACP methyl ester carboxylesterase
VLVSIGDVRLFVDVDGASLVPDGSTMRERPVLIMLHVGPGFDHTSFKQPLFRRLTEKAQVVYYDHRGNGRSDRSTPLSPAGEGQMPLTRSPSYLAGGGSSVPASYL